jgi:hypothetical protein
MRLLCAFHRRRQRWRVEQEFREAELGVRGEADNVCFLDWFAGF